MKKKKTQKETTSGEMDLATRGTLGKKHSLCCVFSSWKISRALENLTSARAKSLKIKINDVKRFLTGKQPRELSDSFAKGTMAIRRMSKDADKLEAEPVVGGVGHTVEEKDDQELSSSSSSSLPKECYVLSKTARRAASEIMEAFEDNDVKLIGLTGMGHVGKTTLAELMGMKAKESGMFDAVIKVSCRSSEGFKPDLGVILLEIRKSLDPKWNAREAETDGSKASELIGGLVKRWEGILIILDDVWEVTDDLKAIGIPLIKDHKGCKILLTTRLLHVCQDFHCQKIIHLEQTDTNLDDEPKLFFIPRSVKLGSFQLATYYWESDIEQQMVRTAKSLKRNYDYLNDTKKQSFFLLCSHFPRKYAPTVEELTRYGIGQGLFSDYESIESARKEAHSIVSSLRSSVIVEEEEDYCIRMCDPFHMLAPWIENSAKSFKNIQGVFRNELSEHEKIEIFASSTTIFLQTSQFPDYKFFNLEFFNLHILIIIEDEDDDRVNFYKDRKFCSGPHMAQLNVLSLQAGSFPSGDSRTLSLEGIENLKDLQTLQVKGYKVKGLSSLVKLTKLEILGFLGCTFEDKLPEGLGELDNLKMLDFSYCVKLHQQPHEWILKLSKLEELYITDVSLESWSSSCFLKHLQELNPHLSLVVLSPEDNSAFFSQQFVVPKFASYRIELNSSKSKKGEGEGGGQEEEGKDQFVHSKPNSLSKALRIRALPLSPFVELFKDVEYLHLSDVEGYNNIIPSLDKGGLSGLQDLRLHDCYSLKNLINGEDIGGDLVQVCAFSKLTNLELVGLHFLQSLWNGGGHMVNLGNLKSFQLRDCPLLSGYIFPKSIAQSLAQLEILEVSKCSLAVVFEQCSDGDLVCLPKLAIVKISNISSLRYVFPSYVIEGLPELRELQVSYCYFLEHVFISSNNEVDEKSELDRWCNLELPRLRLLVLGKLVNLKNFCQGKDFNVAPLLEDLQVDDCKKLEPFTLTLNNGMCPRLKKLCLGRDVGSKVPKADVAKAYTKMSKWSTSRPHFIIGTRPFDSLGTYFLSNLKELKVKIRDLKVLWKDSTISGLQNLTHLSLDGCGSLEYVFTPLSVHNVPNLKCLRIEDCDELGQIVAEDETTTEAHGQQHRPTWFPNLTNIYISSCPKLSNVFPAWLADDQLRKLKRLQVVAGLWGLRSLTQIFGPDSGSNEASNSKVVQLPLLQNLILDELANMARFAPEGLHFKFPVLDHLEVRNCTKMQTSFYATEFPLPDGVCAITESVEIKRSVVDYAQLMNAPVSMLSGGNYKPWRDNMMIYFKSQDLWEVVEQGITGPLKQTPYQKKKDALALLAIKNAVAIGPTYSRISGATSARDAWLTLENAYSNVDVDVDDPQIRKIFSGNEQETERWRTAKRLQMDGDNNILWPDGRSASEHEKRIIIVDLREPDGLSALDLI